MQRDTFTLDFGLAAIPPGELVIDNFAGGGGASTGLEMALGRPVDIAINHDPQALALHAINHPHTLHLCESVWAVDPVALAGGRPVGLVWLSPDCKHFSRAKGATPVAKHIRGLAWVGMRWAALCRPRMLMLENVQEFQSWGPLLVDADGNARPDPARRGETFASFVRQLRAHGYRVQWSELRACDYGAPTIRKRLFLIARRDGQPIVWPTPTHGAPGSADVLADKLAPYRTAAECIDFSLPVASIFARSKPLAHNTGRRIAKGLWRHVLNCTSPFIVNGGQIEGGHAAQPPDGAVVAAHLVDMGHGESSAGRFSHGIRSVASPLNTITASGGTSALVAACLEQANGGFYDGDGHTADAPVSTITAAGSNQRLVTACAIKYYSNGSQWQALHDPVHTVTTKERIGLVQAIQAQAGNLTAKQRDRARQCAQLLHTHLPEQFPAPTDLVLMRCAGACWALVDIGLRMLRPRELFRAQGFPMSYVIDEIPDPCLLFRDGKQIADPQAVPRIPLTTTAQVRMCGNSVCPPMAAALVRANFRHQQMIEAVAA